MLPQAMQAVNDAEGDHIPGNMPFVVDAHVHLFPDELFHSIWQWFDTHAWPIRYRLTSARILDFLFERGVGHVVALTYAHRPGIAEKLNDYMCAMCAKYSHVTGLATVFPGEPDAERILVSAFRKGLQGVKLHAHVQCFDLTGKAMQTVYRVCQDHGKPLVIHAGREPKSPAYACDPYVICGADKIDRVLSTYPDLKVCVPHLGFDELSQYERMIQKYDTLWLDTAMVTADFFPGHRLPDLTSWRMDRILYGTDFPNLPYAWDHELRKINSLGLPAHQLAMLMGGNAAALFSIDY